MRGNISRIIETNYAPCLAGSLAFSQGVSWDPLLVNINVLKITAASNTAMEDIDIPSWDSRSHQVSINPTLAKLYWRDSTTLNQPRSPLGAENFPSGTNLELNIPPSAVSIFNRGAQLRRWGPLQSMGDMFCVAQTGCTPTFLMSSKCRVFGRASAHLMHTRPAD